MASWGRGMPLHRIHITDICIYAVGAMIVLSPLPQPPTPPPPILPFTMATDFILRAHKEKNKDKDKEDSPKVKVVVERIADNLQ